MKYLSKEIEKSFKKWAGEYYYFKRGFEGKGFTIMVNFFLSKEGQEAFQKWKVNQTQKDPMD